MIGILLRLGTGIWSLAIAHSERVVIKAMRDASHPKALVRNSRQMSTPFRASFRSARARLRVALTNVPV